MPTPVEILRHQHRIIEKVLIAIEGPSGKIEQGEAVAPDALSQVIAFIREFADGCHHQRRKSKCSSQFWKSAACPAKGDRSA